MSSDNLNVADILKYADLQMAAEAVYGFDPGLAAPANPQTGSGGGFMSVANLIKGNLRNSVFTKTEATDFFTEWTLVEHLANPATGFSGSLFKGKNGELVLSFRSTEFIDDAVRDNTATNMLEIDGTGFAWGQIDDMQKWFESMKSRGLIDVPLTVTGYSLGGHLATAFNLLHHGESASNGGALIKQVYTFNGAGLGLMKGGAATTASLSDATKYFASLWAKVGTSVGVEGSHLTVGQSFTSQT